MLRKLKKLSEIFQKRKYYSTQSHSSLFKDLFAHTATKVQDIPYLQE